MLRKNAFIRVISLLLVLCVCFPGIALAASFKAKVYTSAMKVYESSSTSSKVLDTLSQGTEVKVASVVSGWAKISYSGGSGFCLYKNLKNTAHDKLMYTTKTVTVYKTASNKGGKVDKLSVDYPVYVVGENDKYYLVDDKDGRFTGYVLKTSLSDSKTSAYAVSNEQKSSYSSGTSKTSISSSLKSKQSYYAESMGTAALRSYIAYIAECRLGCKYEAPGSDAKNTYNNWGFVYSCFKAAGCSIPGSVSGVGNVAKANQITRKGLKIGDIVCFDCDATDKVEVDHIGIYVGNGYFVHSSPTAGCVVITGIDSKYWKNAFKWGRRVIE